MAGEAKPTDESTGPAPWESKETLAGLAAIIGYAAMKAGYTLSADDLLIVGSALMIVFRLFANSGPIDWARLTKR